VVEAPPVRAELAPIEELAPVAVPAVETPVPLPVAVPAVVVPPRPLPVAVDAVPEPTPAAALLSVPTPAAALVSLLMVPLVLAPLLVPAPVPMLEPAPVDVPAPPLALWPYAEGATHNSAAPSSPSMVEVVIRIFAFLQESTMT
jgi:hypothetical protein